MAGVDHLVISSHPETVANTEVSSALKFINTMDIKIPNKRKGNFLNIVDLAHLVSEKLGVTPSHAEIVLRETEDIIFDILLKGYNVSFKFGKLCNKKLKSKKAYDAINRKHIITKERRVIKFYESTIIRNILKGKSQIDENNRKQTIIK